MVWVEFNRFLSYYKDSEDLNFKPRSGKEKKNKKERKGRYEVNYARFYINLGLNHGLSAQRLMGIVNEKMRDNNARFGKIEIMKKFSFFEIDKDCTDELLAAFENAKYKGEQLSVELVKKSKTPYKKKEKSERNFKSGKAVKNGKGKKRSKSEKRKKDKKKNKNKNR